MSNREWLRQGNAIKTEIKALQSALRDAQAEAEYITSHSFTAGAKKKGVIEDEKVIKAIRYQEKLEEQLAEKQAILKDIAIAINQLPDALERTALIEKYINGKSTRRMAREMHYTIRRIQMFIKNGEDHIVQPK